MKKQRKKLDSQNNLIKKSIKAEEKASIQSFLTICYINEHCQEDNCPNKAMIPKFQDCIAPKTYNKPFGKAQTYDKLSTIFKQT